MKKHLFTIILLLTFVAWADAQTPAPTETDSLPYPQILTDMPNVHIVQDPAITQLMQEKIAGVEASDRESTGWRVQVYSSNIPVQSKSEALALEAKLKDAITQPVYIISTPPFIKVRVGDFRTQEEAQTFKNELISLFPEMVGDTYIVRDDHIKIR